MNTNHPFKKVNFLPAISVHPVGCIAGYLRNEYLYCSFVFPNILAFRIIFSENSLLIFLYTEDGSRVRR